MSAALEKYAEHQSPIFHQTGALPLRITIMLDDDIETARRSSMIFFGISRHALAQAHTDTAINRMGVIPNIAPAATMIDSAPNARGVTLRSLRRCCAIADAYLSHRRREGFDAASVPPAARPPR